MARSSFGARTMDGASMLRCMAVALTTEQLDACRTAVVPVELVAFASVPDACTAMSTILPLIVAINAEMSEADRDAVAELATACGSELFEVEPAPTGRPFTVRILDALARAERRRFKVGS